MFTAVRASDSITIDSIKQSFYVFCFRGGSIMIVDFGRVVMKSDLQSESAGLEDATQMELEERLYDRLHVDLSDLQLLFCDSGSNTGSYSILFVCMCN
jgi:hypothetical protein